MAASARVIARNWNKRANDVTSELAENPWIRRLGRFGLVSRGTVYTIVGGLILHIIVGSDRQADQADKQGAFQAVARQPAGRWMLLALAGGLGAYALWRLLRAAIGPGPKERPSHPGWSRVADVGRAAVYVALALNALQITLEEWGAGSAGGGDSGEQQQVAFTARLMQEPFGRWLVAAIGAGVIAIGGYLAYRALARKFMKPIKTGEMSGTARTWVERIGMAGYAGRAIVAVLLGVFVIRAAVQFDPQEAAGLDVALARVAAASWGPPALAVVAAGVLAFGVYSFLEARWRAIFE